MVILRDITPLTFSITQFNNDAELEKGLNYGKGQLTKRHKDVDGVMNKLSVFITDYRSFKNQIFALQEQDKKEAELLARKKEEEKAQKRIYHIQGIKSGTIPIQNINDAIIYYDALDQVDGFGIVTQTPLIPDNKYYWVGGLITDVSEAQNGQYLYTAQRGKDKTSIYYFMFFQSETEKGANLRRMEYRNYVGKFIKVTSKGNPVFMMYYCE